MRNQSDTKINEVEAIGQRLREVRGGMTQAEFAEKLGVDRQTVMRYETGKRVPDALVLKRLIELNVNAHWLLTGQPESNQTDTNIGGESLSVLKVISADLNLVIANLEKGKG